MNPAFSVVFLTTLIGVGQGLLLALYAGELAARAGLVSLPDPQRFIAAGVALAVAFAAGGLVASFFHLGRPERAWRSAARWRTSWLSREVIALPMFMALATAYGVAHVLRWPATLALGAFAALLGMLLFVCTAMIYACIKFLQEWSSPLTVINYVVLGIASGTTLAAALSAFAAPELAPAYALAAAIATALGLATRSASLARNARLRPRSTMQTAIGVRHPHIVQKSQGSMGGSFNTREFFHGRTRRALRLVKWGFLLAAFVVPLALLLARPAPAWLLAAFLVQFGGLLAERWFFLAEANHPQNLYYQAIA